MVSLDAIDIWHVKSPASDGVMSRSSNRKSDSWRWNRSSLLRSSGPADNTSLPFLHTILWSPETCIQVMAESGAEVKDITKCE